MSGNYTIGYTDNLTSTINKARLEVTATDVTKTYDRTLTAPGTGTVGGIAGAATGETVPVPAARHTSTRTLRPQDRTRLRRHDYGCERC